MITSTKSLCVVGVELLEETFLAGDKREEAQVRVSIIMSENV